MSKVKEVTRYEVEGLPDLFDTAEDAQRAHYHQVTGEKAREFVRLYKPYPSERYNARFVQAIVDWELWNAGLITLDEPKPGSRPDSNEESSDADE